MSNRSINVTGVFMRCSLLILSLLVAGCSTLDTRPGLDAERQMLSEGYSLLRHDAQTLARIKLILYVKFESDDFQALIERSSAFGEQLGADLDRIARDYPGVRVDLDPLPELEKRKRLATGMDKAIASAPVVGRSGDAYERTVLISLANGLNQERHLVSELQNAEPDQGLKKFLQGIQSRMDSLYEAAEGLLEKRYYCSVDDPA
ncbi:MAG: hypothetical protein R3F24_14115 [Gammaproteobacteria bacterium]